MKTGLAETAMYTGISADAVAYASAMAEQHAEKLLDSSRRTFQKIYSDHETGS